MLKTAALTVLLVALLPFITNFLLGHHAPITCKPEESVVVVTGVSSGLGKDIAINLIKQGYTVLGTVRQVADADKVQREAYGATGRLLPAICDVSKPDEVKQLEKYVRGLVDPSSKAKRINGAVGKKQLR